MEQHGRDDIYLELSEAASGADRERQLAFATGLIMALCDALDDRALISQAIKDARKAAGLPAGS